METIDSVNNQSYSSIEHILIDGKSSDETVDIFKNFAKRDIKYLSEPDQGIYDAMNKGISIANGEIIGFLNSDDSFMHKEVIANIVNGFNKGYDLVHGNLIFVDDNGKEKRFWNSTGFKPEDFLKSMSPAHPTFYCKKSVADSLGGFDVDYEVAGDIDFMIRAVLLKNYSLFHIDDTLVKMKLGGVSTQSFKSLIVITSEVWKSFKKNNVSYSKGIYLIGKVKKAFKQIIL
jgi:glycosyltransferase involved in cell wall biosynthesis